MKTYIAFLWHQHQPIYKNPITETYELPWVRLHATKDYYDMLSILDEFPDIKCSFNFVPSLLQQLEEYSQGKARDKYLDLTIKPALNLTNEDKLFIINNFFAANRKNMIDPYPRYKELYVKKGGNLSNFSFYDLLDLQVWFNLAWIDPYWRDNDEFINSLFAKGRNFSEDDKNILIRKQLEICGKIIPKLRELQKIEQIEITVSPFYHPILPIIYDSNIAQVSQPDINLPKFRCQFQEDAEIQILKSIKYYQKCFGIAPSGMWPSEGSLSDNIIHLFADYGIKWICTDEDILFNSEPKYKISRNNIYKPYNYNTFNKQINIIFRDKMLSDLIGFHYHNYSPENAIADFFSRINYIRNNFNDNSQNIFIPIVLDGENCWETYSNDGRDFLRMLYKSLSEDHSIETITITEYLNRYPAQASLSKIWPGSWINANFSIWIGHKEDNTALEYLYETRKFLINYILNNPDKRNSPEIKSAWEKIYTAQGSDWFWWYGDDHFTENSQIFDYLFRQYLVSVYHILDTKPPDYLYNPIKPLKTN